MNINKSNTKLKNSQYNNKNNKIILLNNLILNDINITEKNKDINNLFHLNKNNHINYNYINKSKTTRNSTDIKNNSNTKKIIYSSYDVNNNTQINNYMNKTNKKEEKRKKERALYKKNNNKSNFSHYFYDSYKNIIKNNFPEENHFQTIIFLQKMKSNNFSIK